MVIQRNPGKFHIPFYIDVLFATLFFSYSIDDVYKNDFKSFIFTLKNPHDVEPTQFMKRKDCKYAIKCDSQYGPIFGWERNYDICICDICNEGSECKTGNDGTGEYECHPVYKQSLFVNTAGPDEENYFSVLDYEVFTHD